MMGYLDDEEANRRLWDGDFFHTGDLATRDEDGFLFYRGRLTGSQDQGVPGQPLWRSKTSSPCTRRL